VGKQPTDSTAAAPAAPAKKATTAAASKGTPKAPAASTATAATTAGDEASSEAPSGPPAAAAKPPAPQQQQQQGRGDRDGGGAGRDQPRDRSHRDGGRGGMNGQSSNAPTYSSDGLFVKDLEAGTTDEDLKSAFGHFGHVRAYIVPRLCLTKCLIACDSIMVHPLVPINDVMFLSLCACYRCLLCL
jgi:hypothetical protein